MTFTYADVDGGEDPADAVRWQERVDDWPQVRAYKRRVVELLDGAGAVLDVGCGPGVDVLAVGRHRCVGLDRSMVMCTAAARRGVRVYRADARGLPFADGAFDGVFADRVLQHVPEPTRVLSEMVRVLRAGGRLVVVDPDQETLVIHVPGIGRDLTDRVKALRRDVGYRNGRLASSLPFVLTSMGLADVTIEPFVLSLTDPDDAFGIATWPRHWQATGAFTRAEITAWEHAVERSRHGGFLYSLIYFVVAASAAD